MINPTRSFIDNACYHITTRGNQRQNIFFDPQDRLRYLSILKKAKRKYGILLYSYCLMSNHIHILIQASHSRNISKFMHWVNRGYTAYFNAKYEQSGHLWQGRYRSCPIVKGQYLINTATYIENNPVRAGIANDPSDYIWSSYRERCLFVKKNMLDPLKMDCVYCG